jgi:hypothetical protein
MVVLPLALVAALASVPALTGCGGEARSSGTAPAAELRVHTAVAPLPAPDGALPRGPATTAAQITDTTLRLRGAIEHWTASGPPLRGAPPQDLTLLALRHQRLLRRLVADRALARRVMRRLPTAVRGEVSDTIAARRALTAIPPSSGPTPALRTAPAAPAGVLLGAYRSAERRFGVGWHVLAAVNFVESAFGKVRSASSAGARGPMQFLPATWRRYGLGGDVTDDRDAILGAANLLHAGGAPGAYRNALFEYNHSRAYVTAVLRFARRMRADERSFYTYYSWQVYARTARGVRRLTGPR